jgi:hypothetical protein
LFPAYFSPSTHDGVWSPGSPLCGAVYRAEILLLRRHFNQASDCLQSFGPVDRSGYDRPLEPRGTVSSLLNSAASLAMMHICSPLKWQCGRVFERGRVLRDLNKSAQRESNWCANCTARKPRLRCPRRSCASPTAAYRCQGATERHYYRAGLSRDMRISNLRRPDRGPAKKIKRDYLSGAVV